MLHQTISFFQIYFRRIESFQFIRDYLTDKEESLFNNFLKMNKSYLESSSVGDKENESSFTKFESFIVDKS